MTTIAKISALVLGALLYLFDEFCLGYLAATTVPNAFFEFFGPHKVVALVVEEAVVVAFPSFILALGWGLVATRLVRLPPYRVAIWVTAGLVIAWVGNLLVQMLELRANPLLGQYPFTALLLSLLVPPIWGVLASVSAPLGVLGAGLVAQRSDPTFQRTAPPPLN